MEACSLSRCSIALGKLSSSFFSLAVSFCGAGFGFSIGFFSAFFMLGMIG